MTKRQKLVTREMLENCPIFQESQQAVKEIEAEYGSYRNYVQHLIAQPRKPGLNYRDESFLSVCLNWIFEKLDRIILDEKPAKAEQEASDKKLAHRGLDRKELARKELAIGK